MLLTGCYGSLGRSLWAMTKHSTHQLMGKGCLHLGKRHFYFCFPEGLWALPYANTQWLQYFFETGSFLQWNISMKIVCTPILRCWEHSLCYASPWRLQGSLAPCPGQEKLKQHQCKSVRFNSIMYVRQYCPSVKVTASVSRQFLLWSASIPAAIALGILLAHVPYPATLSQVSFSLFRQPIYSAIEASCPSLFPSLSLPTGQMLLFKSK